MLQENITRKGNTEILKKILQEKVTRKDYLAHYHTKVKIYRDNAYLKSFSSSLNVLPNIFLVP